MANILVVEDEPNMQIGLRDNLEFESYDVTVAKDGEEGLKILLDNTYDLTSWASSHPAIPGHRCYRGEF